MKLRNIFIFNLIVNLFYFGIVALILQYHTVESLIFSLSDSLEYKGFGEWLIDHNQGYCSDVRPFLYPIISQYCYYFFAAKGIWIMQFLCYLISVNLLLIAIYRATNSYLFSFAGGLVMATNLTFIVLTLEGMTEVTVILLISILIYYSTSLSNTKIKFKNALVFLLLLSILVVLKPLFLNLLWISLIYTIISHFGELKRIKNILLLFLCLLPLIVQFSIMKFNHNALFISKIGEITLRDYYFRKLYADVNNIPFSLKTGCSEINISILKEQTKSSTSTDIFMYSLKHPLNAVVNYFEILSENLMAASSIIAELKIMTAAKITKAVNMLYCIFHLAFAIAIIWGLKKIIIPDRKKINMLAISYTTFCYFILLSGISFWQGDRLIITALPLWIFTYVVLAHIRMNHAKANKNT